MEREKLILEPVTKDTILCNRAWLADAKKCYLQDKDALDYSPEEYTELLDYDYPLTLEQHTNILPWLKDWYDYAVVAKEKIEKYIEVDLPAWTEEYCESEDYASNYIDCVDRIEYSKELKEFIQLTLEKLVPGVASDLVKQKDRWFDLLLQSNLEIRTGNMYSGSYNDFIVADSYEVGEYEDQIDISSLELQLELNPEERKSTIAFVEMYISGTVSKNTNYPHFYIHTNTDIVHYFGWTHEHIEDCIASNLTPEELIAGKVVNLKED